MRFFCILLICKDFCDTDLFFFLYKKKLLIILMETMECVKRKRGINRSIGKVFYVVDR